jgi:precorrin-6B methylase 2
MKKITYEIEWNLERFHWWFVGRRKLLKLLLSSLDIQERSFIVDIGCGVGTNLIVFKSMNSKVYCIAEK